MPDQAVRPALAAEFREIEKLIPYARNSRTHSDAQVAQIAASIAEFGFTNPVLADDKGIVAGHGRVLGARKLYAAGQSIKLPDGTLLPPGTVPVLDVSGWTEAQRKAYVIADNQLALNAGWDAELLAIELKELDSEGFDMDLVGFDADALDELLGKAPDDKGKKKKENEEIGGDRFLIMIECADENAQAELFTEFQERGLTCKLS
jgi:ParB-like chromosome segregation protein Spo0J